MNVHMGEICVCMSEMCVCACISKRLRLCACACVLRWTLLLTGCVYSCELMILILLLIILCDFAIVNSLLVSGIVLAFIKINLQ
jgi:hypothetical protein